MNTDTSIFSDPTTLYKQLKDGCVDDWHAYCHHPFVQGLADGTLRQECFRHYLQQDYLFLIHFSRAYALAVVKADNLDDMRAAASSVDGLLNTEMRLHLDYCAQWGLTEKDIVNHPEATANMAYTRYVIERGMSGDILDLYTALSPCAVGYAEIGHRLINDPATRRTGNPYWQWIETYGGDDFIASAIKQIQTLDKLAKTRFTPARLESLRDTFREASRLEIGFWAMGLNCSG
ncbi:thiaminase II [Candidatus Sororendozoicomonas aggregata]|uniref:thiaminase II n=1 Tax=Candidatus Sororendozoicomonas aggregata TaxID=3073239 RepID=UPI002ED04E98